MEQEKQILLFQYINGHYLIQFTKSYPVVKLSLIGMNVFQEIFLESKGSFLPIKVFIISLASSSLYRFN